MNNRWLRITLRKDELYIYKLSLAHFEHLHTCRQARISKKKIVIIVNYI